MRHKLWVLGAGFALFSSGCPASDDAGAGSDSDGSTSEEGSSSSSTSTSTSTSTTSSETTAVATTEPETTGPPATTTGPESTSTGEQGSSSGGDRNCGNGSVEDGEQCDGDDLQDFTCMSLGLGNGSISCNAMCTFDTSMCMGGGSTSG